MAAASCCCCLRRTSTRRRRRRWLPSRPAPRSRARTWWRGATAARPATARSGWLRRCWASTRCRSSFTSPTGSSPRSQARFSIRSPVHSLPGHGRTRNTMRSAASSSGSSRSATGTTPPRCTASVSWDCCRATTRSSARTRSSGSPTTWRRSCARARRRTRVQMCTRSACCSTSRSAARHPSRRDPRRGASLRRSSVTSSRSRSRFTCASVASIISRPSRPSPCAPCRRRPSSGRQGPPPSLASSPTSSSTTWAASSSPRRPSRSTRHSTVRLAHRFSPG